MVVQVQVPSHTAVQQGLVMLVVTHLLKAMEVEQQEHLLEAVAVVLAVSVQVHQEQARVVTAELALVALVTQTMQL
jgi:hypothetical protein